MTKDAYYFPHDSNAKDDPKCVLLIEQLGMEGYGIYWMLVEVLREQPDYTYPVELLSALARRYNTTHEKVKAVVSVYGLFTVKDNRIFFSESLNRRMCILEEKRLRRSNAGKLGNEARWGVSQTDRNAITMRSQFIASKVKESKEEKKESIKKDAAERRAFVAPSLDELRAYIAEKSLNNVDAERFIDHYAANGWRAGKNPMKDWRAAVRNWDRREKEFTNRIYERRIDETEKECTARYADL